MKIYHGSYTAIHEIDLTKCEPKRDFGRGFYGTKLREQAETFAMRKGNRKHTESVITEFEFDEDVYEDSDFKVVAEHPLLASQGVYCEVAMVACVT
jgi:hypothetical protein